MTTEQQQPENHTNAETLETDETMDPTEAALKQATKIANSSAEVVLKYIVVGLLTLFCGFVYIAFKQNVSAPDRLIAIMEESVKANTESLKVQQQSLDKLREFAIQVPMEHRDMASKQSEIAQGICKIDVRQGELQDAIRANSEAVKENTAAVARLIGVIEQRVIQDSPPNVQPPPKS